MYYKDICDKIDELRAERGLSRREIARRAGINENTFASYFKRKRKLPWRTDRSRRARAGSAHTGAQRRKSARIGLIRQWRRRTQYSENGSAFG